jgi:hypothetical protein
MRVTQRTADTLVIEESAGANALIAMVATGIGVVGIPIGWMRGQYLILLVASIFLFYGLRSSARPKHTASTACAASSSSSRQDDWGRRAES